MKTKGIYRTASERLLSFFIVLSLSFPVFANETEHSATDTTHHAAADHAVEGGAFNPSEMIMHHISDDLEFHITGNLSLPLPVIAYSKTDGLSVFSSSKFHGPDHTHVPYNGYVNNHGHLERVDKGSFLNLSITKNVFSMLVVVFIMMLIFLSIAGAYNKRAGQAPKGLQSFFEPIIVFIRDEVVKPSIGEKKYKKYVPYMLTLFFFIWVTNLLGLLPIFPGGANVTGNIAVTMALAVLSLLIINISGNKHYWGHIFWPPGIPVPVKLILAPIELVGVLTKPFALMIRLFANILAGHIVLLSIVSLVFILGRQIGTGGAMGVGVGVVLFTIFMYIIKLFVAALQAYIFTFLTCLFIGQAVDEPAHH